MTSSNKPHAQDDDDLDDLDDIVEQFAAAPPKVAAPPPPKVPAQPAGPAPPPLPAAAEEADLPEDFARQLAEGMEAFMRELGAGAGAGADGAPAGESADAARARAVEWERLLIESMEGLMPDASAAPVPGAGAGAGVAAGAGAGAAPAPAAGPSGQSQAQEGDAFQRGIRQAMEKLRASDSTLTSDATAAAAASSDPLAALLGELNAGLEGEDGAGDTELQNVLEDMMQQLMSRDVLYEPLKELHEKLPEYLSRNTATLSEADRVRFAGQQRCVGQIVAEFEDPAYSDADAARGARVVTLMNEMQAFGSPPAEIMGPLPPGFNLGPDGMPGMPEGCVVC